MTTDLSDPGTSSGFARTTGPAGSTGPAVHGPTHTAREQSRARYPDVTGIVERPGGWIAWEGYGQGEPPIVFVPPWQIVHSRIWKAQVPVFARTHRVVTYDGRGNGRSDRPTDPAVHSTPARAADVGAVLDAASIDKAVLVGVSAAAKPMVLFTAEHPERVLALVFICPAVPIGMSLRPDVPFETPIEADDGWNKENLHFWRRDFRSYLEFFFEEAFPEPHSTKQREDAVGYGLATDPETLAATFRAAPVDAEQFRAWCAAIRCPTLVIQGTEDRITHPSHGIALAAAIPGARLELLEASGHVPSARDPVRVNLLIRGLVEEVAARETAGSQATPGMEFAAGAQPSATAGVAARRWRRALARPRKVLYVSSPIGLGHAQRDVAIADELRALRPDLEIDWLAQHPVTAVLEARGERIHPLSAELASESAHITAEATEHDLNAFQAIRRMDEIMVANFTVLHDAVEAGEYDLVVGDEAWEADYFLHENPELKRTAFVWMTDFVGWLPMPEGGEREAFLTADYNAEMIEHVERFPWIRDRAIFVGDPDDIVPDDFGPGLPSIRDWTERHYAFAGYVTGFDPAPLIERREEVRRSLGYREDERVVVVAVGGSGVGEALLRRVVAAYPAAARRVDGLRMVAVAGPRIDPASIPTPPGVEVRGYVPSLYRHLAVCDLAVVQGGLTTTMELVAARRPFLYFPLRRHFEQSRHVRYRLERYRAGRCMDWETADADAIAAAIAEELDRPVDYRPVTPDGAARAAELIAPLL
jgi:pimeloyl-ACP methyl ester carboxylesterase/predicted glycosyltransferase